MSADHLPYSPLYIKIWTVLSIIIALILLGMFIFGDHILHACGIAWSLLRWICTPII